MREPYSYRACVHYSSSVMPCRAGVDPVLLTDDDGRLPCVVIREITGKHACSKLEFMPFAAVAEAGEMAKGLVAFLGGRCPKCNVPIAAEMEFNESILALPCRHVIRSEKGSR